MKKLTKLDWKSNSSGFELKADDYIPIAQTGGNGIFIAYSVNMYDYDVQTYKSCIPTYIASVWYESHFYKCTCSSFEEGKAFCEEWRNKFWNNLYNKIMEKVFDNENHI